MHPRLAPQLRRFARPAVAVVLVFAQAVAAFGFPLIRPKAGASECGCSTPCGRQNESCCCKPAAPAKPATCPNCGGAPGACCHTAPRPAPKCAKCRDREPAKSLDCSSCPTDAPKPSPAATGDSAPFVKWIAGWKARQCRGDGPLGLFAELPSVPPAVPAHPVTAPSADGVLSFADSFADSHPSVPTEPPPRRG